jgi:hypothetical protein
MGLTRPRAYQIFDIDYKQSVRVITLSNVTLSGGAPTVVDSVTLSAGDRVLVAGQNTGSQNGLYQVSVLGTGSNGTWIRSVDGNETGEIDAGMIVMVTEGDIYKDTQWKLTTNDPIVIGTTALTFEQNSAFAFGNIFANGTAVLADIVGDTVTFTPGNNFIITGNATSDTVTFAVSESPTFTGNVSGSNISTAGQVTATGSITGGNLITAGLGSFGTTVSATGNVTGGNLVSNARIDGGNLYLTSLDANKVVFTGASGQLIDSQNFTFDGVTANIQGVLIVDNVEIDGSSVSSTAGNLLLEAPFVSVLGNVIASGIVSANNNLIVNSTGGEGGQLVMAWAGINGLTGQANSTWNLDVDSSNNLRAFSVNAVGTANVILNVNSATRETTFGGNLLPSANITYNLGSPTQRWNEIFLAGNTIDIGGATISADLETGSLVLRGPTGAEFILTGSSPTDSFGIFGLIEAGNTEPSISTTTGALTVAGGAGIGGNLHVGEIFKATGNVEGGNIVTAGRVTATGNVVGGNITTSGQIIATGNITGGNLVGTNISGTLITAAQTNITSVGTLTSATVTGNVEGGNLITTGTVSTGTLTASGNVIVAGNLTVSGNVISVNVTDLNVVDPIIGLGRGANNTPLTVNDGKDRGEQLWYYTTSEQSAFIGYDNSTGKLIAATNVSVASEVVTVNNYGNLVIGGLESATISATGNANVGNLRTAGQVVATGNVTGGNLTTDGNITGNYLLANITFASGYNTTRLFNGTSEANIGTSGGNLAITIDNTPNVAVFSTSGGNVTGNLYATGNVFGGNILGNGRNLSGIETFRSFAVAGGNTIVADSILDTFTFSAGTGITLVADPTTDTLTIAAAGEGSEVFVDGSDFGTIEEVVTTTDDLGLITATLTSQADLGEIVTSGVFYPTQLVLPSFTVSTLPSATIPAQMIYVSDATGGAITAFSDGTNWRRTSDRSIIN